MDALVWRDSVEESADLISPGELSEPPLKEALAHWEAARGQREMPCRDDIKPWRFPALLPRVFMIRVTENPLAFTYSLVGGENVEAHGMNFTGMKVRDLDDLKPGYGASMHDFYSRIHRRRIPMAARGTMNFIDRGFCTFESVYLPLADQSGAISHIMGAAAYSTGAN